MLYTDNRGQDRRIRTKAKEYIFCSVVDDSGVTSSGIVLRAHEDFPRTQGYILEVSPGYDGPLRVDDRILFNRYADDFVVEDNFRTDTGELVREKIYTLHVADVIATLEF